jgi:hypothetical protein
MNVHACADGNLVLYDGTQYVWANGMTNKSVTTTAMQSDGNLVTYAGSSPVWASETGGNPGSFLALQDNGTLGIYASNGSLVRTFPNRTTNATPPPPRPAPLPVPPSLVSTQALSQSPPSPLPVLSGMA